jgi:predicted DNA binding CopG/RHH family protein
MKHFKKLPKFKNEDEERKFWDTHDATDYFDFSKPLKVSFPNLKPSTKIITIRVPASLWEDLKILANRQDVPYQSLMKIFLAERVREEFKKNLGG